MRNLKEVINEGFNKPLNEAKEKSIDKLEKSLEKALKGSKDRDYDFAVWLDSNWKDVTGWDEDDKFEEQDWHENVHTLIDKFDLDIEALEQGNWESVTS